MKDIVKSLSAQEMHAQAEVVEISPDGTLIAYGGRKTGLSVQVVSTKEYIYQSSGITETIEDMAFSYDSQSIYITGRTQDSGGTGFIGGILIYDRSRLASPRLFRTWAPSVIAVSRYKSYIAHGSHQHGSLMVTSRSTDDELKEKFAFASPAFFDRVASIAFGPENELVAVAFQRFGLAVCDLKKGKLLCHVSLDPFGDKPTCIAFNPDGIHIAVGTSNTLCLWRLVRGNLFKPHKLELAWKGDVEDVNSLCFSFTGGLMVTGGRELLFWDCNGMKILDKDVFSRPVSRVSIGKDQYSPCLIAACVTNNDIAEGGFVRFYKMEI